MLAPLGRQTLALDEPTRARLDELTAQWETEKRVRRLWDGDATVWTGADESTWLGWLRVLDAWEKGEQTLDGLPDALRAHRLGDAPLRHVVVMGMGGSSLCPDVLRATFGQQTGAPRLHVLDSTVPAQVRSLHTVLDLAHSLFVVPSKSGSTIEPNSFKAYFFEQVSDALDDAPGSRFVAITDPNTQLDALARQEQFAGICHGLPDIGGRFSALSVFGMVPAALAGLDIPELLQRARAMADACSPGVPAHENPGVTLGLLLGALTEAGRDKLTFAISPGLASLGGWLEQLVAESTGKHGKGIIPIDREQLAGVERYGDDRVFVQVRLAGDDLAEQDAAIARLEAAGHPIVRIDVADRLDLAQEFFRWEIATAVAGAVLGINPFDQPDVEAAKVAARELMGEYETRGTLPEAKPALEESGLSLFTADGASTGPSLEAALRDLVASLAPGDYFAVNAYLEMTGTVDERLQRIRHAVRDARGAATTLGFGPRFLHSTGQLHKGGPNTGVFLQLTCDDAADLAIPGERYSFGVLKSAQAQGDFQVLAERGRRILRIHLPADVEAGLDRLVQAIEGALAPGDDE